MEPHAPKMHVPRKMLLNPYFVYKTSQRLTTCRLRYCNCHLPKLLYTLNLISSRSSKIEVAYMEGRNRERYGGTPVQFLEMLTSIATLGLALSSVLTCTIARPQVLERRQESFASRINGTRVSSAPVALEVSINGDGRNATAPLLYGWMFEDINVRVASLTRGRVC